MDGAKSSLYKGHSILTGQMMERILITQLNPFDAFKQILIKCGSRGGDRGSGPPPWKITSYMGLYRE